jgi:hypothetical protein
MNKQIDNSWIKKAYPNAILQKGKYFIQSEHRNNVYIWLNRPLNIKSFDYYMCDCGLIISNCGFATKHKCK